MKMMQPLPAGRKPTGPQEINWNHPLARKLSHYWDVSGTAPTSLIDGTRMTVTGADFTPAVQPDIGQCMELTAIGSYASGGTGPPPNYGVPFAFMFDFVPTVDAGTAGVISWADAPTTSFPWLLVNSIGTDQARLHLDGTYLVTWDAPQNEPMRVLITYDGDVVTAYVNGSQIYSASRGNLTEPADASVWIGSGYNSQHLGYYGNVAIWRNAYFNQAMAASISRDPYQFLQPAGTAARLMITTPPPAGDGGYAIPDPKWEEPALLQAGVKPTGPVVIDWDHPMTRDLYFVALAGKPLDLVQAEEIEPIGGAELEYDANGAGFASDGTSGKKWKTTTNFDQLGVGEEISFAAGVRVDDVSDGTLFGRWGSGAPFLLGGFIVTMESNAIAMLVESVNGDVNTWKAERTSTLSNGDYTDVAGCWGVGTSMDMYRDGQADNASTWLTGSPTRVEYRALPLYICGHLDAATELDGAISYIFMWERKLTPVEAKSITANPYQFLIPA